MEFGGNRKTGALLAGSVATILILFTVVATYRPVNRAAPNSTAVSGASVPSSQSMHSSSLTRTENLTTSESLRPTSQTRTITLGTVKNDGIEITGAILRGPCNCTVYVAPDSTYPTLHDLIQETAPGVWLANVTSATTVSVNGIPFMLYTVEEIETLVACSPCYSPPGTVVTLAWIGGNVNGTTMTPLGYPNLAVGDTYVFFLDASFPSGYIPYWTDVSNMAIGGLPYVTAGAGRPLLHTGWQSLLTRQ